MHSFPCQGAAVKFVIIARIALYPVNIDELAAMYIIRNYNKNHNNQQERERERSTVDAHMHLQ